jgi:predicted ATPase/class 3 adenylate cyclase
VARRGTLGTTYYWEGNLATVLQSDQRTTSLQLSLFGPFTVQVNGGPLPRLRSRKGQALLALLTLWHDREVEREWLAGLLWPDCPTSQALATLRRDLTDLRRALGPEAGSLRSPNPRTLCLDLEGAAVDVAAFDAAIARGDTTSLEQAVALHRGPLLEGWTEEWVFQERQSREQGYLQALETLATTALDQGDLGTAEGYLRRAVGVDPLRETAQRALMQALATAGNYAAVLQSYRELRERLHQELNAEPDPETQALFQKLRADARERATGGRGDGGRLTPSPRLPVRPPLLPEGTVTFLFTDIEGSTRLWEQHPVAMRQALARHDALATSVIDQHGGTLLKRRGEGDSLFAVFARATDAVVAATTLQQALVREPWPIPTPLRIRMALHTGEADQRDDDYYGPAVNRCARLRAAAHGGQVLLSQATQALVSENLPSGAALKELGSHRLRDLQQPEQVFQLLHPDLPAGFPPLQTLSTHPNNLPQALSSFIGREKEVDEVKQRLSSTRLLTLTGVGGTGKTRLSLQVAADRMEEYPDGVWLVELAPLSDPALVPHAVATVLAVREEPGVPLPQTLAQHLKAKHLLLVLDNCEHLLSACAALTQALLQQCPHVTVLASSREGLGIAGEVVYRVPSLSLPDAAHLAPDRAGLMPALIQYEAVQLFIDRASAAVASFAVTNQNAPAVAQLCVRLDGIPLAIELAAVRVKAMSVEQINGRIEDRFRLLTGGSRTALPRQQTLRALIDWSYDLLTEGERSVLRWLSVFSGGWTLEAAEAVCTGNGIEEWEVLDLLAQLVQKSLVNHEEAGGEGRYRLLETVRQYAGDRLLEAGEAAPPRDRHFRFFLQLALQAEPLLQGPDLRAWLDRLETEHDNLRAALTWSLANSEVESAVRLADSLQGFWYLQGHQSEQREWLAKLLALLGTARTAARATVLAHAGEAAMEQGDLRIARSLYEESLSIWRELKDPQGTAYSLVGLGSVVGSEGDPRSASTLYQESLAIQQENSKPSEVTLTKPAFTLYMLGWNAVDLGEYSVARDHFEEGLEISRSAGNPTMIAWGLLNLGCVALWEGDRAAARAYFAESLPMMHDKVGLAELLEPLGLLALTEGDYGAARASLCQSLALHRDIGRKAGYAPLVAGLAEIAWQVGDAGRAARLLGAAAHLPTTAGTPLPPDLQSDPERTAASARAALGEEAFAAAWAEGHAMTLEEAIGYALEEPSG